MDYIREEADTDRAIDALPLVVERAAWKSLDRLELERRERRELFWLGCALGVVLCLLALCIIAVIAGV